MLYKFKKGEINMGDSSNNIFDKLIQLKENYKHIRKTKYCANEHETDMANFELNNKINAIDDVIELLLEEGY